MKTDNTLLEEMLSDENFMAAYKQVKRRECKIKCVSNITGNLHTLSYTLYTPK